VAAHLAQAALELVLHLREAVARLGLGVALLAQLRDPELLLVLELLEVAARLLLLLELVAQRRDPVLERAVGASEALLGRRLPLHGLAEVVDLGSEAARRLLGRGALGQLALNLVAERLDLVLGALDLLDRRLAAALARI